MIDMVALRGRSSDRPPRWADQPFRHDGSHVRDWIPRKRPVRRSGSAVGGLREAEGCGTGASDTAFAVTNWGGLAQRRSGDWRVVLGDMAFIGLDGLPVEQADLARLSHLSEDGNLVLADAGEKGLGLFSPARRQLAYQDLPSPKHRALAPIFFAGSLQRAAPPVSIASSRPMRARAAPRWTGRAVGSRDRGRDPGSVLQGREGLMILRNVCAAGGAGCLSVLQMSRANRLDTLLQEVGLGFGLSDSGCRMR